MCDEYILPKKIHKKLFPYHKFVWGTRKYRYYVSKGNLKIESWYTPILLLWIALMFIPSILIIGVPETFNQIKECFQHIFITPYMCDYVVYKFSNGKINSTYEEFMKHATLKKKGKENV